MKKTRDNFVIYKITNLVNCKFYIGSAKYFAGRKGEHLSLLRKGKHHNKHLQSSYNKYGEDKFEFNIIEYTTKEKLIEREQYYLDTLQPQYNFLKVAYSSLGFKHTEECKNKMSISRKGKQNSLGRKLSEETKEKIGKNQIGRIKSEIELNKKRKKIVQLDLNSNFINEFIDSVSASKKLNLHETNIRSCCRQEAGFRKYPKSTGGFKFMYKDQFELQRIKENG